MVWVVKVGGHPTIRWDAVLDDLAGWVHRGHRWVLVHGVSDLADRLGHALGHPPQHVVSVTGYTSRYTDVRTLEILIMAHGLQNARIVAALHQRGIRAVGLRGVDGSIVEAVRKEVLRVREGERIRILRGDYTGRPVRVQPQLLWQLLDQGFMPVIAPLGLTHTGEIVNVDGDRVAAAIAQAMAAEGCVFLTGAPGLLRAYPDERTLIPMVQATDRDALLAVAEGRMRHKMLAAWEALQGGVPRVILGDGRVDRPLTRCLQGAGTWIVSDTAFAPVISSTGEREDGRSVC